MRKDWYGHKETKVHDGRINIPKEFKSKYNENEELIVTKGPKESIAIYTKENFQEAMEKLSKGSRIQKVLYRIHKKFAMSSQTLEGPGRVRLSKTLLKKCNITKEVMVEGSGSYISIWDKEIFDRNREELFNEFFNEIEEGDYDL